MFMWRYLRGTSEAPPPSDDDDVQELQDEELEDLFDASENKVEVEEEKRPPNEFIRQILTQPVAPTPALDMKALLRKADTKLSPPEASEDSSTKEEVASEDSSTKEEAASKDEQLSSQEQTASKEPSASQERSIDETTTEDTLETEKDVAPLELDEESEEKSPQPEFTDEQFQSFLSSLIMFPGQADRCLWHQTQGENDGCKSSSSSPSDSCSSEEDEELVDLPAKPWSCQMVEKEDTHEQTDTDEEDDEEKYTEDNDSQIRDLLLSEEHSVEEEEDSSSEWDVWSESTTDNSSNNFGEFVHRTIMKKGKKKSQFVNLFFDISSVEVMGIDRDAGPLEEYFKQRYQELCLKHRRACFRLGEILSGYPPRDLPQYLAVTLTNWSDQKFTIPFNTSYLFDYFPGEHSYFFHEGVEEDLPDQILLMFREAKQVVKRDYTKQLRPYAWDMFRCGSSFRPHAWEWLRIFSLDPEACLYMTRKDGDDMSHATFTFWPPQTSDRWEKDFLPVVNPF